MPDNNGPLRTSFLLSLLLSCMPSAAAAQIIPVKTVPVATGDQFVIIPSRSLGMGGVSIALDDPLVDPFSNPAKGRLIERSRLFTGTTLYKVSGDDGSGRTVPFGMQFRSGDWFGGVAGALQALTPMMTVFPWFEGYYTDLPYNPRPYPMPIEERPYEPPYRHLNPSNRYVFGAIGRTLPGTDLSVGASVSAADLQALDGVDLLYAGNICLKQFGHMLDYRLGFSGGLPGNRQFDVLLLHTRIDMTHDVYYPDYSRPWWSYNWIMPILTTLERNFDRTRTSGMHFRYVRPLDSEGWRIGGIFTANWKTHPKIPEYQLAYMETIPRDPGNTSAYDLGLGLSHSDEQITFGLDLVAEPIWTYTWGEAGAETPTESGGTIPQGGKTVENHFKFMNLHFCVGLSAAYRNSGLQLGLQLHSISYRLDQYDNVSGKWRLQYESWMEWSPSWGGYLDFRDFQIRYAGRLKLGTGRPGGRFGVRDREWFGGVPWDEEGALVIDPADPGNFLVAPTGAFGLQQEEVITHQISLVIPFGK